jgi:hypothetical protein
VRLGGVRMSQALDVRCARHERAGYREDQP